MVALARSYPLAPRSGGASASKGAWPEPETVDDGPPVVLALKDLIADAAGEVVLFNDSGLRSLALTTSEPVVEEGEVGHHVTATGEDVSGFHFMRFRDGLRLYFQPGLDLILVKEQAKP